MSIFSCVRGKMVQRKTTRARGGAEFRRDFVNCRDFKDLFRESRECHLNEDTKAGLEMAAGFIDMMEIEIVGSEIDGDKAVVTVKMTIMGEETEEELALVLEGGSWKLSEGF